MSLTIEFTHLLSQSRHSDKGHLANQSFVQDYSCHSNLLYSTLGSQSKGCKDGPHFRPLPETHLFPATFYTWWGEGLSLL